METRTIATGAASHFAADGQESGLVSKLLTRLAEIGTANEKTLYIAVQRKPIVSVAPDALVITNRRVLIFRQQLLGRMNFFDCHWLHVAKVLMKENVFGATITVRQSNGYIEELSHLPKHQARRVYQIGQEMEVQMVAIRRRRRLEEARTAAGQVQVNNSYGVQKKRKWPQRTKSRPQPQPARSETKTDALAQLAKLKHMAESKLINQSDFEVAKARILAGFQPNGLLTDANR